MTISRRGDAVTPPNPPLDDWLGHEPPIGAALRPDRLTAQARAFAAIALLGVIAAGLMGGAMYAALGRGKRFARTPAMARPTPAPQTDAAEARADRLAPRPAAQDQESERSDVEQVSESGAGVARFTRVVADLARIAEEPVAATAPEADASSDPTNDNAARPSAETLLDRAEQLTPAGLGGPAWLPGAEPAERPALGAPLNVTTVAKATPEESETERVIVAKANDTLALVLKALGAAPQDVEAIASEFADSASAFAGGEMITVLSSAGTDVGRPLKVSVATPGAAAAAAVALSDDGQYRRVETPAAQETEGAGAMRLAAEDETADGAAGSRASLRAVLYRVAERNRVDRTLVDQFLRICEHDVDLGAPVAGGDRAELLFRPDEGEAPQLVFAKLTVGGKTRKYYQFTPPDEDSADYYDEAGRSATQFLLRKPVAEGRLGDGFGWRIHPVLRDRRFHEGVDYAAPFGSPIVAAGAGVVEKIDSQWGYGKYIRIRHDWGYETTYAHVAGFPRGVTPGARVRQGQPIAYVGSTGLSTGPHLYYEVEINGRRVDPLRIKLAAGRLLKGDALAAFERHRQSVEGLLAASSFVASSGP